jgi:predicted porin
MKKLSLNALLAAGVLAGGMTASNAADLGGNCCADLEERIAELEATTARKGNRKVSLTISGWVAQQVMFWDDGVTKNAYVTDTGTTLGSHVKFTGAAQINSDWSAGYVLHLEAISNDPLAVSQKADNAGVIGAGKGKDVGVLQSFWFLKSNTFGKLSVGLQSSAADNVAILPDGSGSLVAANYVMFDNNGFLLRTTSFYGSSRPSTLSGINWGSLATCNNGLNGVGVVADCDGVPNNVVRYDTPTFGGFSASASWGEDDIWAVAGRYAGEFNSVKVSAAIAYTESTDFGTFINSAGASTRGNVGALQIGGYLEHVPTGLFVYAAYGKDYNYALPQLNLTAVGGGFVSKPDGDNFYIKAGVRQKWNGLGHTVLFGEYGENNDKMSTGMFTSFGANASHSQVTQWGLGLVQEIDAAAMSTWIVYRHFDAEFTEDARIQQFYGDLSAKSKFESLDLLKVGALINF